MTMNTRPVGRGATRVDGLVAAASLLHGLSDPTRLGILRHLQLGEHRVVDLTEHLGLAQSTVSTHLACLRDCGLVSSRTQGRSSFYSLTHPETTHDLLRAAERLLAATGEAAVLCASSGAATLHPVPASGADGRTDDPE